MESTESGGSLFEIFPPVKHNHLIEGWPFTWKSLFRNNKIVIWKQCSETSFPAINDIYFYKCHSGSSKWQSIPTSSIAQGLNFANLFSMHFWPKIFTCRIPPWSWHFTVIEISLDLVVNWSRFSLALALSFQCKKDKKLRVSNFDLSIYRNHTF